MSVTLRPWMLAAACVLMAAPSPAGANPLRRNRAQVRSFTPVQTRPVQVQPGVTVMSQTRTIPYPYQVEATRDYGTFYIYPQVLPAYRPFIPMPWPRPYRPVVNPWDIYPPNRPWNPPWLIQGSSMYPRQSTPVWNRGNYFNYAPGRYYFQVP